MKTAEICNDQRRRQAIRDQTDAAGRHDWNGLDYVEVEDDQLTLTVYFLRKAPRHLKREQVRINGGRRITGIKVRSIRMCRQHDQELDDCMQVTVDKYGDFSTYTLCLVELDEQGRPTDRPLHGFDSRYACVEFTFKAGCPSDLDCAPGSPCPPAPLAEPEISYLAKDYASFRQLILDRLALIMPDWQERHVPDLGITLVELLAYVGDHLSYYQDAVATEAYLDTARQRISVRRHARLVDYAMHEGCNARAWVCVETSDDIDDPPLDWREVCFITGHGDALALGKSLLVPDDLRNVPADQYEVFEPLIPQPIRLYTAHNRICFYTWGDRECCLPRGATSATLYDECPADEPAPPESPPDPVQTPYEPPEATYDRDPAQPAQQSAKLPDYRPEPAQYQPPAPQRKLRLQVGDVLIFEEILGPKTGDPADADPKHRHAVRLTKVTPGTDQLYDPPVPIVEIEWALEDALPFPLCISAIGPAPECDYLAPVSVARGNVILVDHGRTLGRLNPDELAPEPLGEVPVTATLAHCLCSGCPEEVAIMAGWFRPQLKKAPLTFSQPRLRSGSAARQLLQDPRAALPQIMLTSRPPAPLLAVPTPAGGRVQLAAPMPADSAADIPWYAKPDLLGSQRDDYDYVVEIDNDGYAHLRFGDGDLARAPEAGASFAAVYRIGNGPAGNVGAESITHIVLERTTLTGVTLTPRNPLPASGGTSPEPLAEVKLFAPFAFRAELQRAITADDYARLVLDGFAARVQRAAATLRWTGSWTEVLVAIDPLGALTADDQLLREIRAYLYRYRRIGHDLVVARAITVPLDIAITICVQPSYLRGHVKAALLDLFSNRRLPDGRLGFFHPDNLTFGAGIAVSKLVALAQSLPGVQNVIVTKLKRLYETDNNELANGILSLGPLEIARLDNDPDFPENGILKLEMAGGR